MVKKRQKRLFWLSIELGSAVSAIVALIAGSNIPAWSVLVLVALGGVCLSKAVADLGWLKAPVPVGTPIRAGTTIALIWTAMSVLGYAAWPKPPRAHLHITAFDWKMPVEEGGRAEVSVSFENNGNAPIVKALSCAHVGYYPFLQDGREKRLAFEDRFVANEPDVADKLNSYDNEMPVGVDRSTTIKSVPWAQTAIDVFRGRKAVVYVSGKLTYSDAHSTHEARYCGYVGVDGAMKFCAKHNEEP